MIQQTKVTLFHTSKISVTMLAFAQFYDDCVYHHTRYSLLSVCMTYV